MVRGLIPGQQLPWIGHLSSINSKINGLHPVLAPLSKCYPESKGRLPTRYSPVRHFTGPKQARGVLVRLACVKHAASVHSEPGSNSPLNPFIQYTLTGILKVFTDPLILSVTA